MPQRQRTTATIRVGKTTYTNLDAMNPPISGLPDHIWFGMPLGKRIDHLVTVAMQDYTPAPESDPQA